MRPIILFALTFTLGFAGCTVLQKGQEISKYDAGSQPTMTETAWRGSYVLYSAKDLNPVHSVVLDKGVPIGFKKDDKGNIVAVAGDKSITVQRTTTHYWKRK